VGPCEHIVTVGRSPEIELLGHLLGAAQRRPTIPTQNTHVLAIGSFAAGFNDTEDVTMADTNILDVDAFESGLDPFDAILERFGPHDLFARISFGDGDEDDTGDENDEEGDTGNEGNPTDENNDDDEGDEGGVNDEDDEGKPRRVE
jgi:hypothetical protein